MKTGLAIIAGLLVSDGIAGGFDISLGGCSLSNSNYDHSFGCDCTGGSGSYTWNYSGLPSGWNTQGNRVVIPKGRYEDNKVYSTQVEVHDNKTLQSFKKSLFFSFRNGQVNKIAEHQYDFNVQSLIPGRVTQSDYTRGQSYNDCTQNVRGVFDNSDGIGGGFGLDSIQPYYGGSGLYRGDDNNPFLWSLPQDRDFDNYITIGSSRGVRDLIVNGCQSKADPKLIFDFLDRCDNKFRNQSYGWKDDGNGHQNIIWTIDEQKNYLQGRYPNYFAPVSNQVVYPSNPIFYPNPSQIVYPLTSNWNSWTNWNSNVNYPQIYPIGNNQYNKVKNDQKDNYGQKYPNTRGVDRTDRGQYGAGQNGPQYGPVYSGPVSSGPVSSGPVYSGPVYSGSGSGSGDRRDGNQGHSGSSYSGLSSNQVYSGPPYSGSGNEVRTNENQGHSGPVNSGPVYSSQVSSGPRPSSGDRKDGNQGNWNSAYSGPVSSGIASGEDRKRGEQYPVQSDKRHNLR